MKKRHDQNKQPKTPDSIFLWFQEYYSDLSAHSRLTQMNTLSQHGGTSCLLHSIAVSYYSYRLALALRLPVHYRDLIRGGLLHDYFLYNWREPDCPYKWHGFLHPRVALRNAEADLRLTDIERDIIRRHMFPLTPVPPKYRESIIVSLVDKACAVYEFFYRKQPYAFLNEQLVQEGEAYPAFMKPENI